MASLLVVNCAFSNVLIPVKLQVVIKVIVVILFLRFSLLTYYIASVPGKPLALVGTVVHVREKFIFFIR